MMKTAVQRALSLVLILVGLVLLSNGVYLAFAPRIYESTVRIQWHSEVPDIDRSSPNVPFDPYWITFEFEKIQSKMILYPVISNLNLNVAWAKNKKQGPLTIDQTYILLKEHFDVRELRHEDSSRGLIAIPVRSQDAQEAATIANNIAEQYRRHRLAVRGQRVLNRIILLTNELFHLEERIRALENQVTQLGTESNSTNDVQRKLADFKNTKEQLVLTITSNKVDLQIPPSGLADIIDPAEPALDPAYPKKGAIALYLTSGLLSCSLGILLFKKKVGACK